MADFLGGVGETARALAVLAAALAGIGAVSLGLYMAWLAFGDMRAKPPDAQTLEAGEAEIAGIRIPIGDVVKVLPDLVKTAAGLAIAVLLLGTVLLVGSAFAPADSASGASPTPTSPGTAPPPTP
ncbi:MAG TPA: hypothetical protein VM305_04110 [Candidatus Limnocylindrales bacterium]|nr:hypothetical protein [Candidatus Limnocylindrales bacterium]